LGKSVDLQPHAVQFILSKRNLHRGTVTVLKSNVLAAASDLPSSQGTGTKQCLTILLKKPA
jgi:hypothetical protein